MNYKIFALTDELKLEVECIFNKIGYSLVERKDDQVFATDLDCKEPHKLITHDELHDLLVLHRNDVRDAHYTLDGYFYYKASDNVVYFYDFSSWVKTDIKNIDSDFIAYCAPKFGYLDQDYNFVGEYTELEAEDYNWFKIHEGATALTKSKDRVFNFTLWWKWENGQGFNMSFGEKDAVWRKTDVKNGELHKFVKERDASILWEQQAEELPFADDEPNQTTIDATLNERQNQYGDFKDVAETTEQLFKTIKDGNSFDDLTNEQRMAMYMICSKMARIVNGNPNHKDSWHDIAGYATLIEKELQG